MIIKWTVSILIIVAFILTLIRSVAKDNKQFTDYLYRIRVELAFAVVILMATIPWLIHITRTH